MPNDHIHRKKAVPLHDISWFLFFPIPSPPFKPSAPPFEYVPYLAFSNIVTAKISKRVKSEEKGRANRRERGEKNVEAGTDTY